MTCPADARSAASEPQNPVANDTIAQAYRKDTRLVERSRMVGI